MNTLLTKIISNGKMRIIMLVSLFTYTYIYIYNIINTLFNTFK
jgi:hypothetical protein